MDQKLVEHQSSTDSARAKSKEDHTAINTKFSVRAMTGALSVSLWLTVVSGGFWGLLILMLPEGVIRYIVYGVSGIASASFFLWFCKHAYKIELRMLEENITTDNKEQ